VPNVLGEIVTEDGGLLVLGLGNLLCGDDGAGVAAVELLRERFQAPDGARVLDGGTLGLSLLPYVEDSRDAILVDAIRADGPPGSPVRLEGFDVPLAAMERLSVHQVGVADLLGGAHLVGRLPHRLILLGVVPESIELRFGCSASVEAALPDLVERIVAEAGAWGYHFVSKAGHAETRTRSDGARAGGAGL
jgi:hydrogenase maturation protease